MNEYRMARYYGQRCS